jgi:hypothetical protein
MNNFEAKAKIVNAGNSKVLKNWMEHSSITPADFLDALRWVCEDSLDENGRSTREIGLTPDGIVKLSRVYNAFGMCTFFHNGNVWDGALFARTATEKERRFYGETVLERHKITLSCKDRV